jgi:outer membrane lipoprotein-sorting protein
MTKTSLRRFASFLVASCLLTGSAGAEVPDPRAPGLSPKDRLTTLIERVKVEQEKVKTLAADFVQRQENEFLVAPEESKGRFSYQAPNLIRWEYETPKPITLLIDGKTMSTWYRDLSRVDEMQIGKYSEKILDYLGASGSMDELLKYFDVQVAFPNNPTEPYRLDMKPRFVRIEKRLKSLTIWVDARRFVPIRLRYESAQGAFTEYAFSELQVNAVLPADRFQLKLPANVQVRVIELEKGP